MKLTEYDISNPYDATIVSNERITSDRKACSSGCTFWCRAGRMPIQTMRPGWASADVSSASVASA